VLIGFYKNRTVKYFDYGRIKLRPGNKLAPIWVFSNGADGQRSVVDSAPGVECSRPDRKRPLPVLFPEEDDPSVPRQLRRVGRQFEPILEVGRDACEHIVNRKLDHWFLRSSLLPK
jgi:hypothetical protein